MSTTEDPFHCYLYEQSVADSGLLLVFVNKVLFKQPHILFYLMSMIAFIL